VAQEQILRFVFVPSIVEEQILRFVFVPSIVEEQILWFVFVPSIGINSLMFSTDLDRNRVTWETPSSEAIPCHRKPLRRMRLLRDPAQMQV
jgi:hypothetical protein